MAVTVQGCTGMGSLSLTLPKPACLPARGKLPASLCLSSPCVNGKLIFCRCFADLDSDSSWMCCASRQSVPLSHFFFFFLETLTSQNLKERKHHAISSAFYEQSVPNPSPFYHQHLKARRMFKTGISCGWTYFLHTA